MLTNASGVSLSAQGQIIEGYRLEHNANIARLRWTQNPTIPILATPARLLTQVRNGRRKVHELTAERDQLAADKIRDRTAIESAERELVALRSQVRELAEEKDRLAAAKERAQSDAESAYDKLRALETESILDFVKRRYFSRK